MQLFIKKQIGKNFYSFVVEGENLYEMVSESQKLSFPDIKHCGCGACRSDNLILNSRLAMNKFKYVEIKCLDCKGSLVFGCMQEKPDVFYLRKKKDKTYDWKEYIVDENMYK